MSPAVTITHRLVSVCLVKMVISSSITNALPARISTVISAKQVSALVRHAHLYTEGCLQLAKNVSLQTVTTVMEIIQSAQFAKVDTISVESCAINAKPTVFRVYPIPNAHPA